MYTPTNPNGNLPNKCNGLLRNCKNPDCDYHYTPEDTQNGVMACPECGVVREYCSQSPSKGRERCRLHGGETPYGVAHYNFQGKGLSKHLTARMAHIYENIDDGSLLEMTDSIKTLQTRKIELMERAKEVGAGSELWKEAKNKLDAFQRARERASSSNRDADFRRMQEALRELEEVLSQGYFYDYLAWKEIMDIEEQQRKIRNSEIKRRKQAAEIITEDDVREMISFFIHSIETRVKDPDLKMDLLSDLQRINIS